jgi:hypothetical protein
MNLKSLINLCDFILMAMTKVDFVFVIDTTESITKAIKATRDRVVHIARTVRLNYPSNFDF